MTKRTLPKAPPLNLAAGEWKQDEQALKLWNPNLAPVMNKDEVDNTLSILGPIGNSFFESGTTAKLVAAVLRTIGKKKVVVNINSPGGDFFEGLAIYSLLREHPAEVEVNILGVAASAASIIAMAGDKTRVARSGFLMIHNTWVAAMGDRHTLQEAVDLLKVFDASIADIYGSRTGIEAKEIGKMLDKQTWINGGDAVEKGFADEFLESDKVVESAENASAANSIKAEHMLDLILAKAGVPRSQRRSLLGELKSGMHDAAVSATRDAGLTVLEDLKRSLDDTSTQIRKVLDHA